MWFPRIVIPVAAVLPPTLDFLIAVVVVLARMLIYGVTPSPGIVLLPLIVPLVLATALGFGDLVRRRSTSATGTSGVAVPFLIQVGLFVTPVIYPFSLVPERLQPFYALNPMVGVLEMYPLDAVPGGAVPRLAGRGSGGHGADRARRPEAATSLAPSATSRT